MHPPTPTLELFLYIVAMVLERFPQPRAKRTPCIVWSTVWRVLCCVGSVTDKKRHARIAYHSALLAVVIDRCTLRPTCRSISWKLAEVLAASTASECEKNACDAFAKVLVGLKAMFEAKKTGYNRANWEGFDDADYQICKNVLTPLSDKPYVTASGNAIPVIKELIQQLECFSCSPRR